MPRISSRCCLFLILGITGCSSPRPDAPQVRQEYARNLAHVHKSVEALNIQFDELRKNDTEIRQDIAGFSEDLAQTQESILQELSTLSEGSFALTIKLTQIQESILQKLSTLSESSSALTIELTQIQESILQKLSTLSEGPSALTIQIALERESFVKKLAAKVIGEIAGGLASRVAATNVKDDVWGLLLDAAIRHVTVSSALAKITKAFASQIEATGELDKQMEKVSRMVFALESEVKQIAKEDVIKASVAEAVEEAWRWMGIEAAWLYVILLGIFFGLVTGICNWIVHWRMQTRDIRARAERNKLKNVRAHHRRYRRPLSYRQIRLRP